MKRSISRVGFLLLAVTLAGCDRDGSRTITQTRVASKPFRPVKLDATGDERFEFAQQLAGGMHGGGGRPEGTEGNPHGAAPPRPLEWKLPDGWKDKPVEPPRLGSFEVAGVADADCSISILSGEGGGLDANVNRWRGQLGAPALSHDAIAQLPARTLLGSKALVIEAAGTFGGGMGQGEPKPGFKLLGLIGRWSFRGRPLTCFVKMVAPAAVVDAERAHFEALCDSIKEAANLPGPQHPDHGTEPDHGTGPDPGQPEPPTDRPAVEWTAPAEWKKLPADGMRVVTFAVASGTECYVSVLGGDAGGLASNLNRWRNQLGMAPLDDAGLGALPRTKLFGQDVPLVEAAGTYADMKGTTHTGYALLGAIGKKGGSSVFVRMTGPEAEVRAERERFLAFVGSLR